jgi:hypothetical protein
VRLLYSSGLQKDRMRAYESDVKTDGVLAHLRAEETARVNAILGTLNPARVDPHKGQLLRDITRGRRMWPIMQ